MHLNFTKRKEFYLVPSDVFNLDLAADQEKLRKTSMFVQAPQFGQIELNNALIQLPVDDSLTNRIIDKLAAFDSRVDVKVLRKS